MTAERRIPDPFAEVAADEAWLRSIDSPIRPPPRLSDRVKTAIRAELARSTSPLFRVRWPRAAGAFAAAAMLLLSALVVRDASVRSAARLERLRPLERFARALQAIEIADPAAQWIADDLDALRFGSARDIDTADVGPFDDADWIMLEADPMS
jgi:hypothetical protein